MSADGELFILLDRARSILSEHLQLVETEFYDSVLRMHARTLADLAAKAPAEAEYPQAWPMLAQALSRVIGAMQNNDRARAEKWSAVAFALIPLVRADYDALPKGSRA